MGVKIILNHHFYIIIIFMTLTEEVKQTIIETYKNPKLGLTNAKDLYAKINKAGKVATHK